MARLAILVNSFKRPDWQYTQQFTRGLTSKTTSVRHHGTSSEVSTVNPMLAPLRAYGRLQQRRPYLTQISTMATVFFTGDFSIQAASSQGFQFKEYEPIRGIRSAAIGSIWSIPAFHWFIWLGRHFQYSSWIRTIGTKILIQQSMFVPVVNTYFFGMQTLLAGGTLEDAKQRVQTAVPVS
jgi:protein Mpv17